MTDLSAPDRGAIAAVTDPRARRVILYELNEVPWEMVDLYVQRRPSSHLASLLATGRCQTTINDDPNHLSPWRTWPTFHKALYSDDHNSFELGQDPATFRGVNLWDVAEEAGLGVGIFGALQSWPPRRFAHGGFYVPDTFSRTVEADPPSMSRFQDFNLTMTRRLAFSPDASLDPSRILLAGFDIARKGLTPWSALWVARQFLRERRDARFKACRSIVQVLPSFDLYWRLHNQFEPHLSIFFTNHVAGMMHRFWGDVFPRYAEEHGYQPDEVFTQFVMSAMDVFDHQLSRLVRFANGHPDTLIVVAGSMGQGGIPYDHIAETYVLEDGSRLAATLQLGSAVSGLAMYPMNSLEFPDEERAEHAGRVLGLVTVDGQPLISNIRVDGRTVSFAVRLEFDGTALSRSIEYRTSELARPTPGSIDDIGIATAERLGGGNTAYHTPEGIFITYGSGVSPDASRAAMSVLDAAPTILTHLGVRDPKDQLTTAGDD